MMEKGCNTCKYEAPYTIVVGRDEFPPCVLCRYSSDFSEWKPKTQTNADRIRAMTDEEFAEWLVTVEVRILQVQPFLERPAMKADWLDWLKQEVQTNDNARIKALPVLWERN